MVCGCPKSIAKPSKSFRLGNMENMSFDMLRLRNTSETCISAPCFPRYRHPAETLPLWESTGLTSCVRPVPVASNTKLHHGLSNML